MKQGNEKNPKNNKPNNNEQQQPKQADRDSVVYQGLYLVEKKMKL